MALGASSFLSYDRIRDKIDNKKDITLVEFLKWILF